MKINDAFSFLKTAILNRIFRFKLGRNKKRKHVIRIKIHLTEFGTYHTYIMFYFKEADVYITKSLEYCSRRFKYAKITNTFGPKK